MSAPALSLAEHAEIHLAQMEGRYRGLLEAAPDAMVVVNEGGEIVLLNVQAEKQFGYHRDELVGQRVKNIIPQGFAERLIADGTRSAADALAQQIGTGIELVGRRKNGTEFPIEIMLSPLQSKDGILVTAAIRDISLRRAAEQHLAQREAGRRVVENALRESEEQYRMLLDGVQDYAIFMMDPHGVIVSWNSGAERIKGYSADQILGQNFSCFFPPEDIKRGRPEEVLGLAVENGRYEEQGLRVRRDHSRFLASVTITALRDPNGTLRGFSEFSHDLSKSKESEARYRGLLEAAPDAMVVVDGDGKIVLLNVQAEKQFGYRRDELVGQQVKNIIPEGFAERIIADGTRTAAEALAQQIGTGIELSGCRKNGTEFPIEIMLSPLESAEGILVTAAIRDISVRKDAETHLAQMEGRYRGLLEAAPDAMVVVNQHGEIVLLNVQAEKQFGYHRDELVGQQVKNIIPEGFAERLIADALRSAEDALAQVIGTGIELNGRRKNGSRFPIEIMLSPLASAEGILVTAAIRDITDRKQSESALREKNTEMVRANQAKDRFLASMSHELRTPLNGIIGFAEFLADGKPGAVNEKQTEYLGDILTSGRHLLQLINDMLDLVQVQAGKLKLTVEAFPIRHAMEEVFAGVRPLAENKRIQMIMDVAHDLDTVVLDQQRFRQILYNLVSNALKFTDEEGRVSIQVVAEGDDRLRLSVRDSGIGIKAGDMQRLFTEFEQLETGTSRRFGGTGLGLALTREIVHRLGGAITVESELGVGSTFTVILPLSIEVEP
jgi:PAS domain S-box-containing protein